MSVSAKERYQNIKDFCEDLYGGYEETPASENKESEVEIETGSEIKVTEIAEQQKKQYILRNPKVEDDSSTESGKKVTFFPCNIFIVFIIELLIQNNIGQ